MTIETESVKHVLGLSGGKDSSALAIYMRDNYPDLDIEYFFTDTGEELDEVYEYLKKNNMSFQIKNGLDLTNKIISDLKEPKIKDLKNIEKIHTFGQEILKNTVNEINNYI